MVGQLNQSKIQFMNTYLVLQLEGEGEGEGEGKSEDEFPR